MGQVQWLTAIIPTTQEAHIRRMWFKANPGKKLVKAQLNQ
jgi:hypothetical protein